MSTRHDQNAHQHVVVRVAHVVTLGLLAHHQRAHVGLAIMSAGPSTSACTRGPAAIASMLVNPSAFSICAVDRLELGEQHHQVEVRARRRDDLLEVEEHLVGG